MVGKNGKISTFRRISSQVLVVEGGVFLLGIRQKLLQNSTQVGVGSIYSERDGNIRARMNQLQNER